jgi:xanthine dehydrogenase YagS FAD-binding subunit
VLRFSYTEAAAADSAVQSVAANRDAAFLAGGTTMIDLMKLQVLHPAALVDVSRLPYSAIEAIGDRIRIGANVRNSELANHPLIRERFAILSGASAQLRNMATTAGNLMQKTRCPYYRDVHARCNKRAPGSSCDAIDGFNRLHAILGTSSKCIATHHSDMCTALIMLDTTIHTQRAGGGTRSIPISEFYLLPGETPERETVLEHGELITHIELAPLHVAAKSHYLKVRDRASYEFALASAAVALDVKGGSISDARIALGGIATVPWRSREAEAVLAGRPASTETFRAAAEAALVGAQHREHNGFKVELAKRTLVFALEELMERA